MFKAMFACAVKQQRGVSLLELNLALLLGSMLFTGWVMVLAQPLASLESRLYQGRKAQHFYQLASWLESELTRALDSGAVHWQWDVTRQCLLYGPQLGVRARAGQLQWRGGDRACDDSHWQNLNESRHARIDSLKLWKSTYPAQVYVELTGQAGGQPLAWTIRLDGETLIELKL